MRRFKSEDIKPRQNVARFSQSALIKVREILENVAEEGDAALYRWTKELDGIALTELSLSERERKEALQKAGELFCSALQEAAQRIRRYHEHQRRNTWMMTEENGTMLGQLVFPLERVGVYVPGGKAAYPSSVLMNVIPAQIAGVREIVLVTPPGKEGVSPAVLAAAELLGVREIYTVGGAQGIGALAYGTESIRPVDKIVGPGNIYVALAKREVFGQVAIDMIAGPSEVLVISDGSTPAAFAAADLLAQAEHDAMASAVLVATDQAWADEVEKEALQQLDTLPRAEIAGAALENQGAIVVVENLTEAVEVANRMAPEHLELLVERPWDLLPRIQHAGAVFLGSYSPEPVGDYFAGPNHVLPTSGTARFASALSVDDFLKKTSVIAYSEAQFFQSAESVMRLARAEGLEAHARAIEVRLQEKRREPKV